MRVFKSLLARLGRRGAFGLGAGVLALVVAGGFLWREYGDHTALRLVLESPGSGRCNKEVTRDVIERSLALGTRFMLEHQKPAGNFDYEYDWRARRYSEDDNEVRQAGAVWGLALLYRDRPSAELGRALDKGLEFFEHLARNDAHGERCIAYPGSAQPGMGTVALIALAYVEYLSAGGPPLPPDARRLYAQRLDGYLAELRAGVTPEGLWFGSYDPKTCAPRGEPSPYSDGEALLALVKAAKYAGHAELLPLVMRTAEAGHRLNVEQALARESDSDTTKSYYQWSTMAYYELATSGWPGTARFGDYAVALADWEIDVHRTLTRLRNTAYAYEGLIPAYDWARRKGDGAHAAKFACVIDLGLERLISWQVGGPLSTAYTSAVDPNDRKAVGGVQNERREPALRIDVTQHQMHAMIYARDLAYSR